MRRTIGTILLTIPLVILITLLVLNIALKNVMGDVIGNVWKSFVPSISYKEGNFIDDAKKYISEAFEDEEINDLWDMFQDEYQGDGNTIKQYIDQNKEKIEEMTGLDINENTIESIQKSIEEKDYSGIIGNIIESNEEKLPDGVKFILKVLRFVVSSGLRGILIVCIVINILLIAFVQLSLFRWIKATAWATMISGGLLIGLGYIISHYLEGLNITFDVKHLVTPAIIMIICGALARIIYFIVASFIKNSKKEKDVDNVKTDKEEDKEEKEEE